MKSITNTIQQLGLLKNQVQFLTELITKIQELKKLAKGAGIQDKFKELELLLQQKITELTTSQTKDDKANPTKDNSIWSSFKKWF